jgi:hypothetical protein
MNQLSRWLEITFMLIVLYLVLKNAKGFSSAITSLGGVYTSSVKVLQGR